MIKYKLIDHEGYTRRGTPEQTYWLDSMEKTALGKGRSLCTNDVIHFYDSPKLAILFNPIHANIPKPRLLEIEVEQIVAHDGTKGGCKKAKWTGKEYPLPEIGLTKRVAFAIVATLKVIDKFESRREAKEWKEWAERWLSNKERTWKGAREAAAAAAVWIEAAAAEAAAAAAAEAAEVAAAAAEVRVKSAAVRAAAAEAAEAAAAEVRVKSAAVRAAEAAAAEAAEVAEAAAEVRVKSAAVRAAAAAVRAAAAAAEAAAYGGISEGIAWATWAIQTLDEGF